MRPGLHRFTHFLNSAENLLQQANQQPNPSLWLLKNNGRTPFFMLEALAKLYEAFHHKKIFKKLRENHFKIIEDGLGQLDYYDFYISEFENIITVPRTAITYIKDQFQKKSTELNELLLKKGWIGEHNNRIAKIHKKLDAVDWKKEKKEVKASATRKYFNCCRMKNRSARHALTMEKFSSPKTASSMRCV